MGTSLARNLRMAAAGTLLAAAGLTACAVAAGVTGATAHEHSAVSAEADGTLGVTGPQGLGAGVTVSLTGGQVQVTVVTPDDDRWDSA